MRALRRVNGWLGRFKPWVSPAAFSIQELKVRLFRELGEAESIRDYGGLWGVDGFYLEEAARHLGCGRASMIDSLPASEAWLERMDRIGSELQCSVEFLQSDFREDAKLSELEPAEVSLLYDILLHQEDPVHILKRVLEKTKRVVCLAQPTVKDSVFPFPNACINLQFYPPELKRKLRGDYAGWPEEPMLDYFFPGQWIWGQTGSYLSSIFYGFGWEVVYSETHWLSRYLDYTFMRFGRR